jgi:hypothetical protein
VTPRERRYENFGLRHATSEIFQDVRYSDAGSADHWLATSHLGIKRYPVKQVLHFVNSDCD